MSDPSDARGKGPGSSGNATAAPDSGDPGGIGAAEGGQAFAAAQGGADEKGEARAWGTIFAGGREHSLGGIEHARSTAWTPADEAAYLDRVRQKAGRMAEDILAQAGKEAEAIRERAREQGYNAGIEDAGQEIDQFRAGMAEAVSAVLGAIEGQCSNIFRQWREDLLAVARLSVERVTGLELSERRGEMLRVLLSEAVSMLEKRRELVIRVNPEDEPMLEDIIGLTRERFPDVGMWRVRGDASISPGGMVVESESSLAEGRLESRIVAVQAVLESLSLPEDPDIPCPLPGPGPARAGQDAGGRIPAQPGGHSPAQAGQSARAGQGTQNGQGGQESNAQPAPVQQPLPAQAAAEPTTPTVQSGQSEHSGQSEQYGQSVQSGQSEQSGQSGQMPRPLPDKGTQAQATVPQTQFAGSGVVPPGRTSVLTVEPSGTGPAALPAASAREEGPEPTDDETHESFAS
ncbi:hypothetical protein LJC59_02925 [Desulfovibrio sp. OttesenSCG-928-A18]|nr:hypothetical protein [Desulfovibrio sp. OttesenSCG-928-A18]